MLPDDKLFHDVKTLVLTARQNAYRAVDAERVLLNWQVGQRIRTDILQNQRAEFGKQVIKNLSSKLTLEFGSGYNQINLWLFVRLVAIFPDFEIVYAVRKLFSWTHFRIFIRLDDDLMRRFYMEMCRIEGRISPLNVLHHRRFAQVVQHDVSVEQENHFVNWERRTSIGS